MTVNVSFKCMLSRGLGERERKNEKRKKNEESMKRNDEMKKLNKKCQTKRQETFIKME